MAPEKTKNEGKEEEINRSSQEEKTEEVKEVINKDTEKEIDRANEDAKKKALDSLKNQKVGIVNIEEIAEAEARKAADAYMTESQKSLKGFKGLVKKIWKHTFFDEYYRQREVNRVRKEIKDTGNIYSRRLDNDKQAHENAMQGISERFISEYEGTLSKGEEKKVLNAKDPETVNAKNNIKNLINDYATGKIDEEAFRKNKKDIIDSLKNEEDLLDGANNYADNLFEIAQNAKLAIEHGAKLEELDYDLDIIVGKAKSSLKTEAHFNWVDKGIDKMKKSGIGRFVSPAVLSTAVGIAYSISVGAGKKVMSSKAAALVSLGGSIVVSSAFAGANESQRVALERKQHGIEMAEGGSFESGDKRREQMEKYEYQMEGSKDLYQNLYDSMFEKDKDGKDVLKDLKQEDLDAIFATLSDIEARNNLNERNRIDLISYSNIGNVEKERTDLTILTARAKVELRKKLEGDLKNGLKDYKDFDSYLVAQTEIVEDSLLGGEKGISAQDKAFRKYKAGRVAKKMAQTAVAGLIIGGTIQETVAFFKDDVQGVVEGLFHTDAHATMQTPFEHVREWISGNPSHMNMGHGVTSIINGHTLISPEGTNIISNPDGTIDVMRGGDSVSHFLPKWNPDGTLDAASAEKLGADGILLNTTHQIIDGTKEVTGNAHDWIKNHPGETIKVHHDGWYGNDTPNYTDPETGKTLGSDLNELRTYWGGQNGTGINGNGDAILNISHMTADGSFQDGLSVNAQDAMNGGKLMAIIYLDGATQGQGIPVPIGADGNIIFDHNNPIMQQLFSPDAKGQMQFHGKFLEVVEKMGVDKNGIEHIRPLGTLVGEGLDKIKDNIPFHQDIPIQNIAPSLGVENPYFVPIIARRPLEPVAFGKKEQKDKKEDIKKEGKKSKESPITSVEGKEISLERETPIIPIGDEEVVEKEKKINEMTQEEYDGMRDDLKMLNRKIQTSEGIVTLIESDFKSDYGKKRYNKLKHIQGDDKPITFNKTELQTIGDEIERLLVGAKIVKKEVKEAPISQIEKDNLKSDLEMLNRSIQHSEGIITLEELNFKSEYGKKRYNELKNISLGIIPVTFNKDELEKIATEMEKILVGPRKIEPLNVKKETSIDNEDKEKKETEEESILSEGQKKSVMDFMNKENKDKEDTKEAEKEQGSENLEIEKNYKAEDLSKKGTEFKSANGSFVVTNVLKEEGLFGGLFNKTKIEGIYKDNNGKENLVSYNKKELEKELENGSIEITKVKEGK